MPAPNPPLSVTFNVPANVRLPPTSNKAEAGAGARPRDTLTWLALSSHAACQRGVARDTATVEQHAATADRRIAAQHAVDVQQPARHRNIPAQLVPHHQRAGLNLGPAREGAAVGRQHQRAPARLGELACARQHAVVRGASRLIKAHRGARGDHRIAGVAPCAGRDGASIDTPVLTADAGQGQLARTLLDHRAGAGDIAGVAGVRGFVPASTCVLP
ncbi:hypothetical protein G6F65_019070 [Rhizopus arrhizus]|nr:hypothetical protein G6F65_019070 [Rhizopus arrhizus]